MTLALRAADEREEGILRLGGHVRPILWLLLLVLTSALLLFPTHLTLEYQPIQSVSAIPDLPLFAALYVVWLAVLLVLLVSESCTSSWEKPALVSMFALVFLGFWIVTGPYGAFRYDGIIHAAHVDYLSHQADGRIPLDHPNLAYFNFPGMHLLAFTLMQATGMTLYSGVTLLLLLQLVLLAVFLYLVFLGSLKSPSLAALGSFLVVQGNIMFARYSFYPGIWALVFLAMFLVLVNRPGQALFSSWQERLLMLLMLGAATMTHFVTAMVLFFILAGIYLMRSAPLRGRTRTALVSVSTLTAFLVIPLSWDIYWAASFFENVTGATSAVIEDFTEKGALLYLFNLGGSYAGGAVPLWAVAVRYFWWGTIFFLGTFLGLKNLLKVKSLSWAEQLETGGLVGVLMLSAAVTALSPGGSEFYRFLLYGAFFTVPILLRFVLDLPSAGRRLALGLTVASFFVLSFPTFLAHNNLVGTSTYYASELEAGTFLTETTAGQNSQFFHLAGESGLLMYSSPDSVLTASGQAPEFKGREEFWRSINRLVAGFRQSSPSAGGESVYFYASKRDIALHQNMLGVSPDDPGWSALAGRLGQSNKIYDDSTVQLYAR